MDTTIDEQLIKRAQAGDEYAFEQLITQSYDLIYRYALHWSGHRTDAEDIAQLASIKLARNIQQFRFESAFSSWLYRLVINCANDWHRQNHRHKNSSEALGLNRDDTEAIGLHVNHDESVIFLQQVLRLLESLGEGFKETVILVHGEGLNHREAAEILNLKESTVSWRLHQIRKHLHSLPEYEKKPF